MIDMKCYLGITILVIDSEEYPEGKEKQRLREKVALLENKLEITD